MSASEGGKWPTQHIINYCLVILAADEIKTQEPIKNRWPRRIRERRGGMNMRSRSRIVSASEGGRWLACFLVEVCSVNLTMAHSSMASIMTMIASKTAGKPDRVYFNFTIEPHV